MSFKPILLLGGSGSIGQQTARALRGPLGKRKISHAKDVFHTTSVVMPDFDGVPTTAKQTSQNIQIFS